LEQTGQRRPGGFSPEAIFVLSGISQNIGSILAKSLFGEVRPGTVAWIRVSFAAVVLLGLTWRKWWPSGHRPATDSNRPWTRADFGASAVFGISIALMNLFFYLAIDRLELGKSLTIEFIGPIAVAATRRRTRRNGIAVSLAIVGVCLLSGIEIGGNALGVFYILCASTMWATYIVLGSRVARQERGLAGLGVGLIFGAIVLTPFGAPSSGAVFSAPRLLVLCCTVGLLNSVIGYSLDQHVMRRIPTHRFALLLALLPVSASFIAFIALDERPTALDIVGIAFVLAGVIYQQRDTPPAAAPESSDLPLIVSEEPPQ
jgi:inner membrane transporter RhtA